MIGILAPLAALLLPWLAAAPAAAQGVVDPILIQCGEPGTRASVQWMHHDQVATYLTTNAPVIQIGRVRQTARAIPTLEIELRRPAAVTVPEWKSAWLELVLYPADSAGGRIDPARIWAGRTQPHSPSDVDTVLTVELPESALGWLPARWQAVVLLCVDKDRLANPTSGLDTVRRLQVHGRTVLYVSPLGFSAAIGVGAFLLLYGLLALTAAQMHRRQYEVARARLRREAGRDMPLWLYALQPTVIVQDAFGHASLARFQVLLFTLCLAGVYAYVMARTGQMPDISNTVLALLGITLSGSTLARITEGSVVDTPNRLWLFGTGVVDPTPREPRWHDLLAGDGEIDVTRVQALAFSVFAAVALVANGTGDLEKFEIPEKLNYLIGLSQAVYVAGRSLPRDSARRLNEEIRLVREAEGAALAAPGADTERAFETARNGLQTSLFNVFGERFRGAILRALKPGDRAPAAVL